MTVWQVKSRGLLRHMCMKSRCPTSTPPSRPRMGVHALDFIHPVPEGSRAPLLRSWLQLSHSDLRAHSSHVLHSSRSESQHVGGLDLLGRLATSNWWGQYIRRELLFRLKSHSDDWLRPHPWSCCRCKFTADTGRTHCDDTTEFLRFESKVRLLCSPPPSSPCKELPLLRIQTPRELPAALLSYCSFLNQAWVELITSTQMASLNPNQHHFHYTELNFSWTTQVNNEKKWTDMLPSHEALHWKFLLNKISSQYELILVQTS